MIPATADSALDEMPVILYRRIV